MSKLSEAMGQDSHARYVAMRERVKLDLGQRGLGNSDLAGLQIEDHIEDGEITAWTITVELTGGRAPLVYTMSNEVGAELHCDGVVVQRLASN